MRMSSVIVAAVAAVAAIVAGVATSACRAPSQGEAQILAPDVVYHGGKIVTANERFDIVEALAVKDGRIVAAGTDEAVRKLASANTRLVDLGGKTALPGFYDDHIHLGSGEVDEWEGGLIDAVTPWLKGIDTVDGVVAAIEKHAASVPKGEWIQASIAREYWSNSKIPRRTDLDKASSDHPIVIARGPHTIICNSLALQKAGITKNSKNPPGGWFFRDENGDPDGRVLESARRVVWSVVPGGGERARQTDDGMMQGFRATLLNMARLGITSVNVAGVNAQSYRQLQRLYEGEGENLPRSTVMPRVYPGTDRYDDPELGVKTTIAELEAFPFRTGFGNERLKVGALKMSIDGGLSAPVFWSAVPYKESYLGPNFFGVVRIPADTFYRVAKRAHELGWQIGVHTMGDGAVVMVVDQLEKILAEQPRADHRDYLIHMAVKPPEATLQKIAKLGIRVSSQPNFTVGLGSYAEDALEGEREQTQNPAKSLLDHGIRMSFGSDDAPYGPLVGIYTAVTRKGYDGEVRGAQEAVSVQQAIQLYTIGGATTNFEEKYKGTLEVGKVADIVVLGEDILTVAPDRIRRIPIERTIVGGREIYAAR